MILKQDDLDRIMYRRVDIQGNVVALTKEKIYRFMTMAYQQGKFSKAKKLKVGTLIVNEQLQIVGTGYNGTPKSVDNECENPTTGKTYDYVIHSEINAVLNATTNDLRDCIVFITDSPCLKCASVLVQKGVKNIFYLREYRSTDGLDFLEKNLVGTLKLDESEFEYFLKNDL